MTTEQKCNRCEVLARKIKELKAEIKMSNEVRKELERKEAILEEAVYRIKGIKLGTIRELYGPIIIAKEAYAKYERQ